MTLAVPQALIDAQPPPALLGRLPRHTAHWRPRLSLSVLVPVYNERHLVAASVERVLALSHETIERLEVIVVDDRSTDGSWDVLQRLAAADDRVRLVRHDRNQGKGAAIRTAIRLATGDVSIVHDADMEYNPADIPAILRPFVEEGADAVFGSRYMAGAYRRALMRRHTLINKAITGFAAWFSDLDLTDVETCYKAVNTTLLQSLPLRYNDFRFEVELTMKLAKRRARVFEVPIRYVPRTREEGKKIRMWDGVLAALAVLKYTLIDDVYADDEYGSRMVGELQHARKQNKWLADTLRPHLGQRVLELDAGVGTMTGQFIPRDLYVAADSNPHYLHYLRSYAVGKPYLRVVSVAATADGLAGRKDLAGQFDTALVVGALERAADDEGLLAAVRQVLDAGGRVIVVVPAGRQRAGTLDSTLGHRRRYEADELASLLGRAGFAIEAISDFNRSAAPAWFVNGKVLRRRRFSRVQLKATEVALPLLRRIDQALPWQGLNLIAVASKPRELPTFDERPA